MTVAPFHPGRRKILISAGRGALVLAAAGATAAPAFAQNSSSAIPVSLKKDFAPTEREQSDVPQPDAQKDRIGFAVIGLGRLALDEILPAFAQSKHAYVAALVSGSADKMKAIGSAYNVPTSAQYSYADFDKIKDNPNVQVVYIVLPNALHLEFAQRAAAAGKHVLTEKPMAISSDECRQMIKACKDAGRLLMVAYRMQYEPYNREIVRLTRSGELGKLRTFEAQNGQAQGDPDQWRLKKALSGGGSLPDIGIYCLNAVRFITGLEPIRVQAMTYSTPGDPRFKEVEELVAFTLQFPNGVTAQCQASYNVHSTKRFRLGFENGWAELDPAFGYNGQRMRVARKLDSDIEQIAERILEPKNQFALELDHMAECIRSNTPPRTGGPEGLQDQILMEAIYASAETGKAIALPEVQTLDGTRGPELKKSS